jgi:hypothetical protein
MRLARPTYTKLGGANTGRSEIRAVSDAPHRIDALGRIGDIRGANDI